MSETARKNGQSMRYPQYRLGYFLHQNGYAVAVLTRLDDDDPRSLEMAQYVVDTNELTVNEWKQRKRDAMAEIQSIAEKTGRKVHRCVSYYAITDGRLPLNGFFLPAADWVDSDDNEGYWM